MIKGLVISLILLTLILIPIYCCQVSNEDFKRITREIQQKKQTNNIS